MKVSMGMDVASNPNPLNIRESIDIHRFTHYVHNHNRIGAFQYFDNILAIIIWKMEGEGERRTRLQTL
jgi:hypothetical protein